MKQTTTDLRPISMLTLPLLLASLASAIGARAQVPSVLSYQGRLQASGTNFTGTGYFRFAIVDRGTNRSQTAQAVAVVGSRGEVSAINVVDPGSGYLRGSSPSVSFAATGGGSGARATATVSQMGGYITEIIVTAGGSGYSQAFPPKVLIEPPPVALGYTTYWSHDGSSTSGGMPTNAISVPVTEGLFTVLLGDTNLPNMNPLPAEVFAHPEPRFRIWFGDQATGGTRLTPDQPISAAAYAMMAARVTDGAITAASLAPGAVTGTELADGSVTTAKLANSAVTTSKLADGAVGTTELADAAVTRDKIGTGAIISSHLANNAVTTDKLAASSISTEKLATGAVTQDKLASGAVVASKIANGAVNSAAIQDGQVTAADLDMASFSSAFWKTAGNSGTTEGTHYLGTSDAQALDLRVNGVRALRLQPDATSPNLIGGHANNSVLAGNFGSVIGGGGSLAGGYNYIRADYGVIGGGSGGLIKSNAYNAVITGGDGNQIGADSRHSAIGGGFQNIIEDGAVISTIPGGYRNRVAGNYSLAAGYHAAANHNGTFVWADSSSLDDFSSTAERQFLIRAVRGVGINTNNPQTTLHVNGETTTTVLTITGGSDVAEPFPIAGADIPAGSLVTIDPKVAGQLVMSDRAYDKRVAGIVSGANGVRPGLTLHQADRLQGGRNVALSGRVYALADATQGSIEPGDLLTTSETPGHAMKVTDHARAQGAIIGKAMSGLHEGRGFVLVLVSLQ